jgi:hypothetical protein
MVDHQRLRAQEGHNMSFSTFKSALANIRKGVILVHLERNHWLTSMGCPPAVLATKLEHRQRQRETACDMCSPKPAWLFGLRGGAFYCVDNHKGKRTSLHTTDEEEARQIVEARNQSERQQVYDLPDLRMATNCSTWLPR